MLVFVMEILELKGDGVPANRCDPSSKKGCSEREGEYVDKQSAKDAAARAKELKRLSGMNTKGTKPELLSWLNKRKAILEKMVAGDGEL